MIQISKPVVSLQNHETSVGSLSVSRRRYPIVRDHYVVARPVFPVVPTYPLVLAAPRC